MAQWYYTKNGQQAGPVALAELQALVGSGQVSPSDMVWKDGMANWQPWPAVPELSGTAGMSGQQYPAVTPQYAQPQYPAYAQPGQDHYGRALTSFILALVGLFCGGVILGIISIVLSVTAMNAMKLSGNQRGHGFAIAGLVIGILDIPLGILGAIAMMGHVRF